MTRARDVASLGGLTQIIPTSLSVGSTGSATVAANGTITVTNGQWIIANGVFTSKYQNYKIIANVAPGSNQGINMRLVTGGTQNTTTNYFSGGTYVFYAGGTIYGYNANSATQILVGVDMNTGGNVAEMNVFNPQSAGPTQIHSMSAANSGYFSQINHIFNQGTQFDGFQLYAASAGIYGTIRVYGYNNG